MLNFSKHLSLRAVLNGLINALLLNLALDFSVSIYAADMAPEWNFVLSAACSAIGVLVFLKLLPPGQNVTRALAFLALSVITFAAAFLLFFCLPGPFPLRQMSDADGLLMIFVAMNFGVIAALGRMVIIISRTIKNHYEKS